MKMPMKMPQKEVPNDKTKDEKILEKPKPCEIERLEDIKPKKRLNLDELLLSLNTDSLIDYCLKNPSLKHFNFLKYMIPDNYLPLKIDIPGLGSRTISKRGGGGFSGAVNTTLEIIKEVLKDKSEKK